MLRAAGLVALLALAPSQQQQQQAPDDAVHAARRRLAIELSLLGAKSARG